MLPIETIAERDREAMMNVIRDALYRRTRAELTSLANRIGRTYDCLIRIRSGRTKWPLGGTLFSLIYVLDLRLELVPAVRQQIDKHYKSAAKSAAVQIDYNRLPH